MEEERNELTQEETNLTEATDEERKPEVRIDGLGEGMLIGGGVVLAAVTVVNIVKKTSLLQKIGGVFKKHPKRTESEEVVDVEASEVETEEEE